MLNMKSISSSEKKIKTKNSRALRIIGLVVAIVTLLLPFDIVPDLVPLAGFLDDIIAFLYLVSQVIRQFNREE